MKRACKSHLRRQRRKRKGTKSAFRACSDRQACTFPSALADKSEVSEIVGWGIYHHLNSSDFSDDKQCGFYDRFQEKKIPKEKSIENCLVEIHTLESMTDIQKCGRKQICRNSLTDCSLPLFVRHAKGRNGLCPIVKSTKRGHNLFLPKMRRISARQLNYRNGNRKVCPIRKKQVFFLVGQHILFIFASITRVVWNNSKSRKSGEFE